MSKGAGSIDPPITEPHHIYIAFIGFTVLQISRNANDSDYPWGYIHIQKDIISD